MKTKNTYKKNRDAKEVLMNVRLKNILILFLMFATLFCLFSCSNTLPTQTTVAIKRINPDNFDVGIRVDQIDGTSWQDIDVLDGTSKVTAFIGAKFSRTITERSFTVLSEDGLYRLLYKFDGKTYSDSPTLNHPGNNNSGQKPFTGNVTAAGSEFTLYAYYTYEMYEVKAVEISGSVSQKRFTTIPANSPQTLTIKLNRGRSFDPNKIQSGTDIPDKWVFPRIEGLSYSISSISQDYTTATIDVTGIPLSKTPYPLSSISLPSEYVKDVALDDLQGENSNLYTITDPIINVTNQTINGSKYKEIKKGEQELVFRIDDGASFNSDELKVGDSLKDYDGFSINYIDGLEYEITSINENVLTVSVYGFPTMKVPSDENDGNLNFSRIKEKYIKYGTSDDVIENTADSQPLQSGGSRYVISDIAVELTTSDGDDYLNLVNNVTIPENASKVITLKITSGAKFRKDAVPQNEEVDWSSFVSIGEVQGLNFKFGSLEDREDGSILNILVYGTPRFMTTGETPIVVSIPTSAIEGAPDSESVRISTLRFVRNFVKLEVVPYNENVRNYGTEDNPLRGTSNINLGNGDGVRVHLLLRNATFNGSVERYLKECFSGLQNEFNYSVDDNTYTLVTGGGAGENDVIVLIKGAPINLTKITTPKAVSITLPKDVITNGSEELTDASANLYYITSDKADLEIDSTIPYEGTYDFPLKATRGVLIGSTDAKEEVSIKLNMLNAEFREDFSESEIKEWFKNLQSWGSDLTYSIKDRKTSVDDSGNIISSLIIKVDGTPTSFNIAPAEADIEIPRSVIKGATDKHENLKATVYYQINGEVRAAIEDSVGTQDNPIKGTQYVMLGNGNGIVVNIRLYGAKFSGVEKNVTDVSSWFKNWTNDAFDVSRDANKPAFTVLTLSNAEDAVQIRINGSIRKASKEDETGAKIIDRVNVIIPRENIKDSENKQFSDNLAVTMYYSVDASMGIEFSAEEELYYGTSNRPLIGVRGVSMNNDSGLDVKLNITNGGTFKVDVENVDVGSGAESIGVETWFSSFGDSEIKEPKYTIVRGGMKGDNYVVIHISGALMSESGVLKSIPITLNKALFNGSLINDPTTTLYYRVEADVEAEVSTNAAYFGSATNPLKGVRYVRLGASGDGEEIKIELKNAKFDKTLKLNQSVKEWFASFTDITGITSFTISEIAPDRNYVVVRIKGALTSEVKSGSDTDRVTISIPSYLIEGFLTKNVEAELFYQATAEVSAAIHSGSGYFGSLDRPIVDAQRVALNGGEGVLVRINLENGLFNETVVNESDFSKWFGAFNELINQQITYEAGGSGHNFVVLRVKGSLTTDAKQSKSINVKVPSSAIDGYLPFDLEIPLYYYITNKVTATFDSSGSYKGSLDAPIEGIRYVPLGENGSGVEMRVNLDGALFRKDLNSNDILKWFTSFERLTGRQVTIKDRGNFSYITFVMSGTLTVPEGVDEGSSDVRIPVSDIQDADFNEDVVLSVSYRISGVVSASLDEDGEYYGSENKPITDIQNRPLNDGNGYFVKINLENGSFNLSVLESITEVSSWFTNFSDLKQTTYELYDRSGKYVVVRIRGAITSLENVRASKKISIPSSVIFGSLESNVETDMWYEATSSIDIRIDSRDIYSGADGQHPISGIRYIDLNKKQGVLVRINLIGAKFKLNDGDNDNSYDFSSWFTELSSNLVGPNDTSERYTLQDGGSGRDYVVIRIKGALNVSDLIGVGSATVRVPRDAIDAPALDKDELTATIYFSATSEVRAELESSADYFGSISNPISEDKYVYLNGDEGVLIKINLKGIDELVDEVTFKETIRKGDDVAKWFGEFTNNALTSRTTYTIEDIESDRHSVVVRIKGAVSSSLEGNIGISSSDIDGYLSANVPCRMKVVAKEDFKISLENASEYSGTNDYKLNGKANIMLGDGEGTLIRINLSKGVFSNLVNGTYDISGWFRTLSVLMTDPSYEIVSGGEGKSFVVVRIKGAFKEAVDGRVYINIPASAVASYYYELNNDVIENAVLPELYYDVKDLVELRVSSDGRYRGSSAEKAITGTQYVQLNGGEGVEVKIVIDNGRFNKLSDEKVKGWFSSADNNLESKLNLSDYRIIEGGNDGDSFVVVRVKGAFNVLETSSVTLKIPMEDVKNSRQTTGYELTLHYGVTSTVRAELKNIQGYWGFDEAHALKGLKNIPFNNGDGYLIYINLIGTTFKSDITSGATVDSWFDEFKNNGIITYGKYEIVEGGSGKDYIVIKVTGELSIETSQYSSSLQIKIPANALVGDFPQGHTVSTDMFYNQVGVIAAELETIGYVGSSTDDPINGVSYAPLYTGNEEGVKIKINLVARDNANEQEIEGIGALFSDDVFELNTEWFKSFTDFTEAPYWTTDGTYRNTKTYEIIDGGNGFDYAVVLMKGAITASGNYNITIPAKNIIGHLTSDVQTTLYYKSDSNVTAKVDDNGIYYGYEEKPIEGYQYVPLNNKNGQKIRIVLNGAKFKKETGLRNGGDARVSDWFTNFSALREYTDQEGVSVGMFTVESGGEGENYVVITVNGVLSISNNDTGVTPSIEVNIPSSFIEASLPQNLSTNLYYRSLGTVSASLEENTGRYYGGERLPISGVSNSELLKDDGAPIQMRIELNGAKFKNVGTGTDFSTWFDEWKEIEKIDSSTSIFKYIAGGKGENYVVIEIKGKLGEITTTEIKRVRIKVPSENIDWFPSEIERVGQDVYTNLCYRMKSSIRASIDMSGAYKGSYLYPLTGSAGLNFTDANRYIHISLENAKFKELNDSDIVSWFNYPLPPNSSLTLPSTHIDTSNGGYKIASFGKEGDRDIIIEITGGFKYSENAVDKGNLDIRIPKEHINASLPEDVYLSLYYTCLGKVSISLSSDMSFVGENDENALEGIVGVKLNNGNGSPVRITLSNDAVFNSSIGSSASFGTVSNYIDQFAVQTNGGGKGAYYTDFVITGTPNRERSASSANVSAVSTVSIPYSSIEGCLKANENERITVDMRYIFYPIGDVHLTVSTDPAYYGYASNPLTFIPYIAFGEGDGVEAKLDITLNRSGRHVGKFTPVFNSTITEENLKTMFAPLFEDLLTPKGTYSVGIVAGGPSSSSITVRFAGFVSEPNVNKNVSISVKDCIAGGNEDLTLSTTMYIRTIITPSVTLQDKSSQTLWDWFGTYNAPISGPRGSSLYNMNARLVLSSGLTFSSNLNNTTLGERIKGVLYSGYEGIDTGVVITRGGAGYNFVEFRVDSTTPGTAYDDVPLTSGDVALTYDLISGAVEEIGGTVAFPLYYQASGTVSISVVPSKNGESSVNPVSIVNYVNLDEGNGVRTVLQFANVHLNQFRVGQDVTSWFENMLATIEVPDLTFTVIPIGNGVTYRGTSYPGANYPVSGISVTTADQAVGYTYDTSTNTYTSYIGVWIQGASDNLSTLGSSQQTFHVPITDTNDARVRTNNTITGRMFIERKNVVFSVQSVSSHYDNTSSKVVIGSRNIYLGYNQNTGVSIQLNIQNGHFANNLSVDEFVSAFNTMVSGVYYKSSDSYSSTIGNTQTDSSGGVISLTFTLKGYPTAATFTTADNQVSTTYTMAMLVKWVKGGSVAHETQTIHEMPISLSIGVPQIRSGSQNTIRGFAGMVLPNNYNNRTTWVTIYGNAKFNNNNNLSLGQSSVSGVSRYNSSNTVSGSLYESSAFATNITHDSEATANTYKRIGIVLEGSVGQSHYFNRQLANYNVRLDLSLDAGLLAGAVGSGTTSDPYITTITNNGAYIMFEILDPNQSSYIELDFSEVVQSTPKGQDRLFFTYVTLRAPTWIDLGFSLQDDIVELTKDWDKIGNAGTKIALWEVIKFSCPYTTASKGRMSYVAALRGHGRDDDWTDIRSSDYIKIRCLDIQSWSMNAEGERFYLRFNDNSSNGSVKFTSKWGVDRTFTASPSTNWRSCSHKDDGRATLYNKEGDFNWLWSKSN